MDYFLTNATVCAASSCTSASLSHTLPLEAWRSSHTALASIAMRDRCHDCPTIEMHPGLRPCSRSQERQEVFVLALATALGKPHDGFFVELGGHDGLRASNTVFTESCRSWRGLLIEPNPSAFELIRTHRPGVLAARGAVCTVRGRATFAARRSVSSARHGVARMSADETGGLETLMNQNFERAGYKERAPTAWLNTTRALRIDVPCAPLHDYLALFSVRRVDIFWLDVEGAELAVRCTEMPRRDCLINTPCPHCPLPSASGWTRTEQLRERMHARAVFRQVLEGFDPTNLGGISIGILVVEMRFNDVRRTFRTLRLLSGLGFELVRALPVWNYKILDLVFVRPEHFGFYAAGDDGGHGAAAVNMSSSSSESAGEEGRRRGIGFPKAALELLNRQSRNRPPGANVRLMQGRVGGRYVVPPPSSILECAVWAAPKSDGQSHGNGTLVAAHGMLRMERVNGANRTRDWTSWRVHKKLDQLSFVRMKSESASVC